MPGSCDTGPPISRKIPGNKFNRAEFLRQNKINLEFFAHINQINQINRAKIFSDYVNVIIDKSINCFNSFCDKFISATKHKDAHRFSSNSTNPTDSQKRFSVFNENFFLENRKSSQISGFRSFSSFFSRISIFFIEFVRKFTKFLKKIVNLLLLKFTLKFKKRAWYM